MQRSITSPQGFYLRRKYTTRNYKSVNIREENKTADSNRKNQKEQVRNTASMYITKQRSTQQQKQKPHPKIMARQIRTANNSQLKQGSKSAHRYKKLNFSAHKQNKQTKYLNTSGNPLQDFRRKNQRDYLMSKLKNNQNLIIFLNKVQQFQSEFVHYSLEEKYQNAAEIIISLLNYSVDLNLTLQFTISLKTLADFYIQCGKINQALFYYNQARQSALLLNQPIFLIQSLIGISKCCSKGNLQKQGISILKKALQYSWYFQNKQLQLLLYDQIGQKYYHLGDISKAKQYHYRYVNSIYQPHDSAHKSLSKQRIKKCQQINIELKYNDLSILFLVHLKIPIRSLKQVPPIQGTYVRISSSQYDNTKVRDHFNINKKYFTHFQDMESWVKNIMKTWFFIQQMDQPPLSNEDWTMPVKLKKFAYIDFKLNQHLKKFGSKVQVPAVVNKQPIKFKQNLQQKIQRKLKQPPIDAFWYQKMVQQIVRDHKNKLLNVRNAVRVRGYNKTVRPQIQILKQIYNKFFDDKK